MRIAINVVCIENGAILLLQKKGYWILPGGKPNLGESDLDCLKRENSEEIPNAGIQVYRYFAEFEGKTPNTGDILKAKVYFGKFLYGNIAPAAEISRSGWFTKLEVERMLLSEITSNIVKSLIANHHF